MRLPEEFVVLKFYEVGHRPIFNKFNNGKGLFVLGYFHKINSRSSIDFKCTLFLKMKSFGLDQLT